MTRTVASTAIFVSIPLASSENRPVFLIAPPAAVSALRGTRANASSPCAFARRRIYRTTVARRARALFESARNVCMADVCLTAPAVLSPLSPNESRKRRHGSSGVQGTWLKRHRTTGSRAAPAPSRIFHRRSPGGGARALHRPVPPEGRRCDCAKRPSPRDLETILRAPRARPPTPFSAIAL